MSDRLAVLTNLEPKKRIVNRAGRRQEAEEHFEHLWKSNPEQFNPNRSAREIERIERTWNLILDQKPQNKQVVDLPCGWGVLTQRLKKFGATVIAVDVAESALNHLNGSHGVSFQKECLPHTTLKDDQFDLVISTDVISYLHPDDFRLYFAELARIIKPEGTLICSTNIDIYSEDALQRFVALAETEFEIDQVQLSYHAYHIRLCNFFEAPEKFIQASRDKTYRKQALEERRSLNHSWFKLNSISIPALFWRGVNLITNPIAQFVKQNRSLLLFLEKICNFFSAETGISHVIFSGKRRPLFTMPPQEPTFERKHKREVWE